MENDRRTKDEDTGWIISALRRSEKKTKRYFAASMAFYAVVMLALVIMAVYAREPRQRNAFIAFSVLTYLGFNGLWISALRGLRGQRFTLTGFLDLYRLPLSREISELEDVKRWNDMGARLVRANEVLQRRAEAEREHRAWPNRLLSLGVITAIDLLVWLVFHNPALALVNQVIAMAISQLHISLGPKDSMEAVREYRKA